MHLWLAVLALATLAGCGTYAVRIDPPPRVARAEPIDLTVSLGEVVAWHRGRRLAPSEPELAALDAEFVRAVRATRLFHDVLPRGSASDLYCDVERRLERAPESAFRALYVFFVGPVAATTPGVPYPVDYRVRDEVSLRTGEGTSLARGAVERGGRAWLRNFWSRAGTEPLGISAGESLAVAAAEALASDDGTVRRFEVAQKAHPENAMLLGWLEEQRPKDAPPAAGASVRERDDPRAGGAASGPAQ
jgi:hypothetical protein